MKARLNRIVEGLESHPELIDRFEHILGIVENIDGSCNTADEAEERTIEELRKLGNELMGRWAEHQETHHAASVESTRYRKGQKKLSIGKAALV